MPTTINYQALQSELNVILAELDQSDLDIDHAIKQYQRGVTIIKQLENYLKTAENKVKKVRADFDV